MGVGIMNEDFKRTLGERKIDNLNKMGRALWEREARVAGVAVANRNMAESWSKVLEVRDQAAGVKPQLAHSLE